MAGHTATLGGNASAKSNIVVGMGTFSFLFHLSFRDLYFFPELLSFFPDLLFFFPDLLFFFPDLKASPRAEYWTSF
jgi:hypothetical protein